MRKFRFTRTKQKIPAILALLQTQPELSYRQVAALFSVGEVTVIGIAKEAGITRRRGRAAKAYKANAEVHLG